MAKQKQYRKKGWDEEKIERAIAELQAKHDRHNESFNERQIVAAQRWIDFIHDLLALELIRHVGLLVHFYNHPIDSERFDVRQESISTTSLSPEGMMNLQEDVIYMFSRQ